MTYGNERRFLLPLSEYNRIYQVSCGVLKDVGKVERGCTFFATFGAYVLNRHYKIPASAVAGAFALCVGDGPDVACFGNDSQGRLCTSEDGFHMWVQTKTHIIDFMAPVFPEAFADTGLGVAIPRKMLQRPISSESRHLEDLCEPGQFITFPDPDFTERLIDNFLSRAVNRDLFHVADAWFGSRRAKQKPRFAMQDNHGNVLSLSLPSTVAAGAW